MVSKLEMMFATENGIIDFEEIDLSDTEDITIADLANMGSQMNNGKLDIDREVRRRGIENSREIE